MVFWAVCLTYMGSCICLRRSGASWYLAKGEGPIGNPSRYKVAQMDSITKYHIGVLALSAQGSRTFYGVLTRLVNGFAGARRPKERIYKGWKLQSSSTRSPAFPPSYFLVI